MIGKDCLRHVIGEIEKRDGARSCRGELILAIQHELFGSVRISLKPEELAEVFALLDDKPQPLPRRSAKRRAGAARHVTTSQPIGSTRSAAVP